MGYPKYSFIFVVVLIFNFQFSIFNVAEAQQMTEQQIQEQEAKWRAELEATEKEIAQWESVLNTSKKGTASLERDASILQAKINEAKAFGKVLKISARGKGFIVPKGFKDDKLFKN